MLKRKVLLVCILLSMKSTYGQINLKNNLSVKVGHSLSVTQWGLSPLSVTRRLEDRSINGIFFNVQYAFKIKRQ